MLGFLHILIYVRLEGVVPLVVFVIVVLTFFLIHFLATQALKEVNNLLVVEGIRKVLRDTLESTELTHTPISLVFRYTRCGTNAIGLVNIRSKHRVEVQGIVLREFESQTG